MGPRWGSSACERSWGPCRLGLYPPSAMRIGVNLLFVEPGAVGGSEALLTNLVRAVGASGHDLVVAAMRGFRSAHPDIESFAEVVEVPWRAHHPPLTIVYMTSWLSAIPTSSHPPLLL